MIKDCRKVTILSKLDIWLCNKMSRQIIFHSSSSCDGELLITVRTNKTGKIKLKFAKLNDEKN